MLFSKRIIYVFLLLIILTLNLFALSEKDFIGTKWVQEESFYENSNFKFYLLLNGDNSFDLFSFEIGYLENGFFECVNDTIYLNYNFDNAGNFSSQEIYYLENEKLHLSYLKELENECWRIEEINVSKQIYFKDKAYSLEQPFPYIRNTKWISSYHEQPDYYEFYADSTFVFFDSRSNKKFSGNFFMSSNFQLDLEENTVVNNFDLNWNVSKSFISYNYKLVPLNEIVQNDNSNNDHNIKFDSKYYFIQDTTYIANESFSKIKLEKRNEYSPEDLPGLVDYEEVTDSTGKIVQRSYSFKFPQKSSSKTKFKREETDYDMELQIKEIEDGSLLIRDDFSEYSKPYIDDFVKPEFQSENQLTGSVTVSFYILSDNSVADIELVNSTNEYLLEYVLKIIEENKFVAVLNKHGNPVKARVVMTYFFAGN